MRTEIRFALGKNEDFMLNTLGGRSIVVVRQTKILQLAKFKFDNFNSACLGCLNGFMVPIASYQRYMSSIWKETLLRIYPF